MALKKRLCHHSLELPSKIDLTLMQHIIKRDLKLPNTACWTAIIRSRLWRNIIEC